MRFQRTGSPLLVVRKNVISRLRFRVTREPALGVVPLRRGASHRAGLECIGRGIVIEYGISPSAAVPEPLAILHHEVYVQQLTVHRRLREERVRRWAPTRDKDTALALIYPEILRGKPEDFVKEVVSSDFQWRPGFCHVERRSVA